MGDDFDFAKRMKERRAAKEDAERAAVRQESLDGGAADQAWQKSYQETVMQFGAASREERANLDYFLEWDGPEGRPAVILNLGAVHSFMKRRTRAQVVKAMVECVGEYISAPRTQISFVCVAPSGEFEDIFALEHWAVRNKHTPLRVLKDRNATETTVYVRSNGSTDWFGRSHDRERPVMVFRVP